MKYTALLIAIMTLITAALPVNILGAAQNAPSATVIKVKPGVGRINVNGTYLSSEKPYKSGRSLYIPLRSVMEAFGADVIMNDDGKISVLFKNVSAELFTGKTQYVKDQTPGTLPAPPVYKGKTVMVPSDFITKTFDITESTNINTGETSFILENDGALTDLSFLTGSLNKPRAGNSYFGWSLAIPKGSLITAQTFNSKYVQFENDFHNISIEISVQPAEGKSLEEYYDTIVENPYKQIKSELTDSRISGGGSARFIELFYTDTYDEAIYHRIYSKNGYFYNLTVTSFNESDPGLLLKDRSVTDMLASFRLDYKGGTGDTSDLSKVSYGLSRYSNYIVSDNTGKKFASWEMSILPEWDQMTSSGGNPYITKFGAGTKDYVSIETSPPGKATAEAVGTKVRDGYLRNYNPELFSVKNAGMSEVAGVPAYSLTYEVKLGKTLYTYLEKVLVSQGLAYDITFRTTSDAYEKKKENFENMLKTFKPYGKDAEALTLEMEKYKYNSEKNRLGKDDRFVLNENRTYLWNITLPGNWQKNTYQGFGMDTFTDSASMGVISIEAISKKTDNSTKPDDEKFSMLALTSAYGFEPAGTETLQAKGRTVKVYKYRVDNDETDDHGNITYYVLEGADYQYCYMSSLPDLTGSAANLKTLASAWDSFNIVEKSGE